MSCNSLIVRRVNLTDEAAFLEGFAAWEGEDPNWFSFHYRPGMPFTEHLAHLEQYERGENLPAERVPSTMLYAFLDGHIIGRVSIRHCLNEALKRRGGHIGWAIAPAYRGRGHGSAMVRQALPYARQLGLSRLLVSTSIHNFPSQRIVERLGGVREMQTFDQENQEHIYLYWLDLDRKQE